MTGSRSGRDPREWSRANLVRATAWFSHRNSPNRAVSAILGERLQVQRRCPAHHGLVFAVRGADTSGLLLVTECVLVVAEKS